MRKTGFPLIFVFLLLASTSGYSQFMEDLAEPENIRIHLAPLNFFDPVTAVLQVGVQKRLSDRFSVSLDHGFKSQTVRKLRERESNRFDHRYSKTKAELKYFYRANRYDTWSRVFPYLSVEAMYFPQTYRRENDWIFGEEASYAYESSSINRPVWVGSLKYGKEIRYRKVVLDSFFGLGVRRVSIRHSQTVGAVEELYYEDAHWNLGGLDREEGTFWRLHVSLGVKFGIPFEL